jgi:hypothetical protein
MAARPATATTPQTDAERVAALREQITAIQADLVTLDAAPLPYAEAARHLGAALDQLVALYADHIAPTVLSLTRETAPNVGLVELLLPDPRFDARLHAALLATVLHDTLLEHWRATLRQRYEKEPALVATAIPLGERAARAAALRQRLRECELAEEQAICAAHRGGMAIDRRADVTIGVLFDASVLDPG